MPYPHKNKNIYNHKRIIIRNNKDGWKIFLITMFGSGQTFCRKEQIYKKINLIQKESEGFKKNLEDKNQL